MVKLHVTWIRNQMCLRTGAESLKPRGELDWQEGRGGVEKETFHKVKQNFFIFTILKFYQIKGFSFYDLKDQQ